MKKKKKRIFDAVGWIGKNATEDDLWIGCSNTSWGLAGIHCTRGLKRDWKPEEWPPRCVRIVVEADI